MGRPGKRTRSARGLGGVCVSHSSESGKGADMPTTLGQEPLCYTPPSALSSGCMQCGQTCCSLSTGLWRQFSSGFLKR